MHKAGIDPEYLAKSFLKLQAHHLAQEKEKAAAHDGAQEADEAQESKLPPDDNETPEDTGAFNLEKTLESWMSSHPDIDVRIRTVRDHAKELGPLRETYTFDLDWSVIERMKLEKIETEENNP